MRVERTTGGLVDLLGGAGADVFTLGKDGLARNVGAVTAGTGRG